MSEYKTLLDTANIGADFKTFITSNIGKYLIECAERDEMMALRELAAEDPTDTEGIYKLQLKAVTPKKFLEYLSNAITMGETAKWELEQHE